MNILSPLTSGPQSVCELKADNDMWREPVATAKPPVTVGKESSEPGRSFDGHFPWKPGIQGFDDKTELLTRRGWVGIPAIHLDDLVAYWRSDGAVFFERPKAIDCKMTSPGERMVCLDSKTINLRVAESHRMLVRHVTCLWKTVPALELRTGLQIPAFGLAEPDHIKIPQPEYSISKRRISANAYNLRRAGMAYDDSFRVAVERAQERSNLYYTQPDKLSIDDCHFIGFSIADGSYCRLKSGGIEYTLCQSTRYPHIIAWIDRVILGCGFDAIKRLKPAGTKGLDYYTWSLPRGTGFGPQRREGVFRIEPYLNKNGSDYLWGLSELQFDAVCEGYWLGDGRHGLFDKGVPSTLKYDDTNRQWIDLLCAIGSVRNWRCAIGFRKSRNVRHKDQWALTMVKFRPLHISCRTPVMVKALGPQVVWSISANKSGIITRRDGHVIVIGNVGVGKPYDDMKGAS
jgi:hypothetical protein